MIKKLVVGSRIIEKHNAQLEHIQIPDNADYVICQVGVDEPTHARELLQRGFEFLDRVLLTEINLAKISKHEIYMNPTTGLEVTYEREYSPEMYTLAQKAFTSDRRFHLEPEFNDELAAPIITAYIDQCKSQHMPVFKVKHFHDLLGYTIIDECADDEGNYFENVLGVTMPGIKGKMIAAMLYSTMLNMEKAKFKKYLGWISAANAPSINLHFQLGGKVISSYDEYIYRVSRKKSNP